MFCVLFSVERFIVLSVFVNGIISIVFGIIYFEILYINNFIYDFLNVMWFWSKKKNNGIFF